MSYCRFRNTWLDLYSCLDAIDRGETLSRDEAEAGRRMFDIFLDFCLDHYIITGCDNGEIKALFDSLTAGADETEGHHG